MCHQEIHIHKMKSFFEKLIKRTDEKWQVSLMYTFIFYFLETVGMPINHSTSFLKGDCASMADTD